MVGGLLFIPELNLRWDFCCYHYYHTHHLLIEPEPENYLCPALSRPHIRDGLIGNRVGLFGFLCWLVWSSWLGAQWTCFLNPNSRWKCLQWPRVNVRCLIVSKSIWLHWVGGSVCQSGRFHFFPPFVFLARCITLGSIFVPALCRPQAIQFWSLSRPICGLTQPLPPLAVNVAFSLFSFPWSLAHYHMI